MVERLVVISDRHRFVWVQNPKVASTSMHAQLVAWRGADETTEAVTASSRRPSKQALRRAGLNEVVLDSEGLARLVRKRPGHYYFCFVRNPYARLLSAYTNKLTRYALAFRPGAYYSSKVYQHATGWPTRAASLRGLEFLRERIPFAEVVEGLQRYGLGFDGHFFKQADIVRPDIVPYHRIGRLETFGDDMAAIQQEIGVASPGATEGSRGERLNATGAGKTHEAVYTPRLHQIVHQLYEDDFERFGYAA